MDNEEHILRVDVKFKNISINKYFIGDILFNVLFLHDVGCTHESHLVIGTLVPLGKSHNQTLFVYVGPNLPAYQIYKVSSKQAVSSKIDYLSSSSFIFHYFVKYEWKGYGLVSYEKGTIHVMQLPTKGDKDKQGLSFKGPQNIKSITQIHEI